MDDLVAENVGPDPKIESAACAYLLVSILQKLEREQSGLIESWQADVRSQARSIPRDAIARDFVESVFNEVARLLAKAKGGE